LKYKKQELANRYTDGAEIGGNMLTKFYSKREIRKMFREFDNLKVEAHDSYDIIDYFPHRFLPLGKLLPFFIKKWISKKLGLDFWIYANKRSA